MTSNIVLRPRSHAARAQLLVMLAIRCVAAAGLLIDAWIHADLAPHYDVVQADISEGTLFRLETAAAAGAAFFVLVWWRWYTAAFAFLVAVSAITALLLSTYTNPGEIGPLPNMYEPTWFAEKTTAFIVEVVAAIAAFGILVVHIVRRRASRY